jgi:thiamine pyrophosphokinase
MPDLGIIDPWLEPYDFVIAADSGLVSAERAGMSPDLIIGDMDSLEDIAILERYPASKKRLYGCDKDYSDTELAMAAMTEKGIDDITIVGGDGGRMDHFFALRMLFDREVMPSLWIGTESAVIGIGEGSVSAGVRVDGLESGEPVSIFATGRDVHRCKGSGFHWNPDGLDWDSGAISLSNRSPSGSIDLIADSGRFLLVVPFRLGIHVSRLK